MVAVADGDEAVDLGQTPADIVVLSSAESELACLAGACAALGDDSPSLRLASLLSLRHPLSVDLYLERVVSRARLVVLRLLGGAGYWRYGLEQTAAVCRANRIALAVLPGDDRPDLDLDGWSTLPAGETQRFWSYLVHGGVGNATQFLLYAQTLIGTDAAWLEPTPLPPAGRYEWRAAATGSAAALDGPRAALVFYRALVQSGNVVVVDALIVALTERGIDVLPLFVTSLKDGAVAALVESQLADHRCDIILNATGFAVGVGDATLSNPFAAADCPVLQVVFAGTSVETWREGLNGLTATDLAMNVVLPELDGRILARAVSFKAAEAYDPQTQCRLVRYAPAPDRIAYVVDLAANWIRLRRTAASERIVALILANYPTRDGRIGNGVGLDTPASAVAILHAMADAGYTISEVPESGNALLAMLTIGVTNEMVERRERSVAVRLSLGRYRAMLERLPPSVQALIEAQWGPPEADPHVRDGAFALAVLLLGHVVVGIQPARGYNLDPARTYHSPDLVPPHAYLAFYLWLRHVFGAHAIIHLGKHGNLEWLPGKAVALSEECLPEVALGPLPNLYPFIVNDPGEGCQAKRRSSAVIVDHLTPPLTRAETYGPLRDLESLVDEYYAAAQLDPRRIQHLRGEIVALSRRLGLDRDLAIATDSDTDDHLAMLDAHLCELKELQIRDGLHVFGTSPTGDQRRDLLVALLRVPRNGGDGQDASLHRALAVDLGFEDFDPLNCPMQAPWTGPLPLTLAKRSADAWRSNGDTVERIEMLASAVVAGIEGCDERWERTAAVLRGLQERVKPAVESCGLNEVKGLLTGLAGRFVAPGSSGAPTRGRLDVLPTGRNFYSIDTRAVPTPTAWHLGWRSAGLVLQHHLQTHGDWPKRIALSAWGTSNMRTGGDDIAQALAFLGCRPVWDGASNRVTGIEVLTLELLGRPRVDVTLRVSGFFRDAFAAQMDLVDDAVRAVAALDEPEAMNPLAAASRAERDRLLADGADEKTAERRSTIRVFGSKPGAYGAGMQALIDEGGWADDVDFADAFVAWGGFAYGRGLAGADAPEALRERLTGVEVVLHNQDNREHDILDSDDYYQFQGGMTATVRHLSGRQPETLHADHSRPESPRIRTLRHEIGRIVRGRAANPKWIAGVMRHGYKGASEIAATVDYLFAFAATARVVDDHHFDALFDAYLADDQVREFIATNNLSALGEIARRFAEAIDRNLWRPSRNSARELLDTLLAAPDTAATPVALMEPAG